MLDDAWSTGVSPVCRVLSDNTKLPVLLVRGEDLRILEANPAAVGALGVASDADLLLGLSVKERGAFDAMLTRLRAEGTAPGIVVHLGPSRTAWLVRASRIAEWAPVFMLHLMPAGLAPAVLEADAAASAAPASGPALSRQAMRAIVADGIASVERSCIFSVLALRDGDRDAVAGLMGISTDALAAKLDGRPRK